MDKVVLAYSGGLDTSVAIRWLAEKYGLEVVTMTVDLGEMDKDLEAIREKALKIGASQAIVLDAKDEFVRDYIFPALQAGAIYEEAYPLATALGRPLIAKLLAEVAEQLGASAVAHGSTGKGNDQVRFEVTIGALAPRLKVIAPIREWDMSREEEIRYAQAHNIPVPATVESPYSVDQNLWGRSIECGILEDPWAEPPEEVFQWVKSPKDCPAEPLYLEITFDKGLPVALDGQTMGGVKLISKLNQLGGKWGVGRIDHLENRLVGIKSREVYESPAAIVLHKAHRALEDMTLTKDQARFKGLVSQVYADLIYNGLWFSPLRYDLLAFVESCQQQVTGTVRVRLHQGNCLVVGRRSPFSLYDLSLATYEPSTTYDSKAAEGFTKIWGLPLRIYSRKQQTGRKAD